MIRFISLAVSMLVTPALAAPAFTFLDAGTPPGNRRSSGAAIKPGASDTYLIFGGFNGGGAALTDLVTYGTASNRWTAATSTLPGRERHGLAYDPVHDRYVIVGGASGFTLFDTALMINGTPPAQSTPALPAVRPSARIDPLLVWIPAWNKFLYFGGRTSVFANNHVRDLWSLDVGDGGVTWAPVPGTVGPTARGAMCAALDPGTGKLILFGGEGTSALSDTWLYDTDAGTWASPTVSGTVPSGRSFTACVWDPRLKELVLYGGQTSSGTTGGLFTFNPATNVWTAWSPAFNPGTLSDAAAVFSEALGGTILFGGSLDGTTYTNRTWLLVFNRPPAVDAGADFSIGENALATLRGSVVDPEGDPTTTSWAQTLGPALALSDSTVLSPTFTSPAVFVPTQLRFMLTGSDDGGSASASVNVTVLNDVNEAPVAEAGPNASADGGVLVALAGSGSDPNGDPIVSYAWSQTAGPVVTLSSNAVPGPTFTSPTVPVVTVLTFALVVRDATLSSEPDQVFITVAASDAGVDAGVDAGIDAGVDAGVDAGEDAGTVDDAGVDGGEDAGTLDDAGVDGGEDAGAGVDAGTSDAGTLDAGFEEDAGVQGPRVLEVGCGCTEFPVSALWPTLGILWLARRRRAPHLVSARPRVRTKAR